MSVLTPAGITRARVLAAWLQPTHQKAHASVLTLALPVPVCSAAARASRSPWASGWPPPRWVSSMAVSHVQSNRHPFAQLGGWWPRRGCLLHRPHALNGSLRGRGQAEAHPHHHESCLKFLLLFGRVLLLRQGQVRTQSRHLRKPSFDSFWGRCCFAAPGTGAYAGPTISGCSVSQAGSSITVQFNSTLLRGGAVGVKPYDGVSAFSVSTPASLSLSLCLSVPLSLCPSVFLPSVFLPFCIAVCLSLSLSARAPTAAVPPHPLCRCLSFSSEAVGGHVMVLCALLHPV